MLHGAGWWEDVSFSPGTDALVSPLRGAYAPSKGG